MKVVTIIALVLLAHKAISQSEYYVTSEVLNVREGPGKKYDIIGKLSQNDLVYVDEKNDSGWWQIRYSTVTGYVASNYLSLTKAVQWESMKYSSGATPDCLNISPEYDHEIDNYLRIQVGSNTDVVVKLMLKDQYNDRCIRIVYVNSGDVYFIRNIPEGLYYLKIAYGKDYRQSIVDEKCYVLFMENALYKKGTDIMDFNVKKTINGQSIPSYELFLDVSINKANELRTGGISEAEFNN